MHGDTSKKETILIVITGSKDTGALWGRTSNSDGRLILGMRGIFRTMSDESFRPDRKKKNNYVSPSPS